MEKNARARRFALRFPVRFQRPESPVWFDGVTKNISRTGVLLHAYFPESLENMPDLVLRITVPGGAHKLAEIQCKGKVVRWEKCGIPDSPTGMAVAIRDVKLAREAPRRKPAIEAA